MHTRGLALRTGRTRSIGHNRMWATAAPSWVPTVLRDYVFGAPPAVVQVPYGWLAPPVRFRPEPLINVALIDQTDGASVTSTNTASRDAYGTRAVFGTLDTACDADPANLAAWLTTYRGDPRMRQPTLVLVDLAQRTDDECMAILRVREGDRVVVTDTDPAVLLADTFSRTISSDWDSADTGQVWTCTGGSASDFSVSSGLGRHSIGTTAVNRRSTVEVGATDLDLTALVNVPVLLTGSGSGYVILSARSTDTNDQYEFELRHRTTATIEVKIARRSGGVLAALTPVVSMAHVAADQYAVRIQAAGSMVRMKVWDHTAGSEPAAWTVSATDPTVLTGTKVSVWTVLDSGITNTLPVVVTFDNVRVLDYPLDGIGTWPQGAHSLVVEGLAHSSRGGERKVGWVTSAVAGAVPGEPGPWFRWGSSHYGSTDVIPF